MRRALLALALALVIVGVLIATTDRADAKPRKPAGFDYPTYMTTGDSTDVGAGTTGCYVSEGTCPWSYSSQANVKSWGRGGACISTCIADYYQIREWLPEHVAAMVNRPEVLVVGVGLNDTPHHEVGEIVAAMKDLRATMDDRFGIRVVFATITPAPAGSYWNIGPTGHGKATRLGVNQWLRSHAEYLGPDYAKVLSCPGQDLCPAYVSPGWDDVHYNDLGAQRVGQTLRNWIEADQ